MMAILAFAFLIFVGIGAVEWTRALLHRAPGVSLFSPRLMFASGFTTEGRKHRRRCFQAWVTGALLVLATLLFS